MNPKTLKNKISNDCRKSILKTTVLIFALICGICIATPVFADTFIVPDQYPDIPQAAAVAASGDTILVKAGLYSAYFPYGGTYLTLPEGVNLIGAGPDITTISAMAEGYYSATAILAAGNNRIEGFHIDGKTLGIGLYDPTRSITIKNCTMTGGSFPSYGRGTMVLDGSTIDLENNISIGGATITARDSLNILYNVFASRFTYTDPHTTSIQGPGTVRNNVFYNGTAETMYYNIHALSLRPVQELNFINNIVWNIQPNNPPYYAVPGDLAIYDNASGAPATLTIDYSDFVSNRVHNLSTNVNVIFGEHNITANPLFVNATTGDFRLRHRSPCVDAGDPLSPLDPDGTRANMGALPELKLKLIQAEPAPIAADGGEVVAVPVS